MDESIAGLLDSFFLIVGLSVAQIPFIKMAKQEAMGEYIQFADLFKSLLKYGPSIFAMGIAYGLIVVVGYTLYIVPGIVALVIFFLFPYSVLIDDQLHWQSFRRAITIGGSNFFMLLVIILFFLMIDAVLWWGIVNGIMFFFQPNYISLALIHMVLHSLLLPFFSFVTTFFYLKWTTDKEENELSY